MPLQTAVAFAVVSLLSEVFAFADNVFGCLVLVTGVEFFKRKILLFGWCWWLVLILCEIKILLFDATSQR